jgi:predicted nucleotide-binding protein
MKQGENIVARQAKDRIFIVHGRNESVRRAVARFLTDLGKDPVVLVDLPSGGRTIIEKFEHYARSARYAIVLVTPDDVGGLRSAPDVRARARQNVLFELGYFIGKLGRGKVCLMSTDEIEWPSDLHGVVYVPIDAKNQWGWALVHEFLHARIDLDTKAVAHSCQALFSGQ